MEKIKYFPIAAFAIILGLAGLSIAFYRFYHLQLLPSFLYLAFAWLSLVLFLFFLVVFMLKWINNTSEAIADVNHLVRSHFLSAISIGALLVSIAFYAINPVLAAVFWWAGMLMQAFLSIRTVAFWINHNFEIHHFSPLWFIPVVGNILVPVVGVDMVPTSVSWAFFFSGLFFWVILMTINMNRIIFHAQLPEKFIPSLFIMIAPPVVGFISYMRIAQSWDLFSTGLLFTGYFIAVLLLFMHKNYRKINFYLSWWAFTFPLDALTIASALAYQITNNEFYLYVAFVMLFVAVATIVWVSINTIRQMKAGKICIKED